MEGSRRGSDEAHDGQDRRCRSRGRVSGWVRMGQRTGAGQVCETGHERIAARFVPLHRHGLLLPLPLQPAAASPPMPARQPTHTSPAASPSPATHPRRPEASRGRWRRRRPRWRAAPSSWARSRTSSCTASWVGGWVSEFGWVSRCMSEDGWEGGCAPSARGRSRKSSCGLGAGELKVSR